jgi:hypothetical protein
VYLHYLTCVQLSRLSMQRGRTASLFEARYLYMSSAVDSRRTYSVVAAMFNDSILGRKQSSGLLSSGLSCHPYYDGPVLFQSRNVQSVVDTRGLRAEKRGAKYDTRESLKFHVHGLMVFPSIQEGPRLKIEIACLFFTLPSPITSQTSSTSSSPPPSQPDSSRADPA